MVGRPALTRRAALAGLLGTALLPVRVSPAGNRAVLIAGAGSPVRQLDVIDIRRVFLGIPVVLDGVELRALRNESDPALREVFLQNIVSMSTNAYQRRLLALTLEQGRRPPPVYTQLASLLDDLMADVAAISYAWASTVAGNPRIRVLRLVWDD